MIYILSRFTHFFRKFFWAKIAFSATSHIFCMYDCAQENNTYYECVCTSHNFNPVSRCQKFQKFLWSETKGGKALTELEGWGTLLPQWCDQNQNPNLVYPTATQALLDDSSVRKSTYFYRIHWCHFGWSRCLKHNLLMMVLLSKFEMALALLNLTA